MSGSAADARLRQWLAAARLRRVLMVAAFALPWQVAALVLAWRWPYAGTFAACALGLAAAVALAWWATRQVDPRWLARRLDARRADMEDSAALLFASAPTPLQALQRDRLRQRVLHAPPVDLRDPWPRRPLLLSAAGALLAIAALAFWPMPRQPAAQVAGGAPPRAADPAAPPRLLSARLEIAPPPYTGLPARTQRALEARVPEGATLRWTLRFAPQPPAAVLRFHDGRELALQRRGEDWSASLRVDRATLYRLALPAALPAEQSALHRIDVVADAPPVLRTLQPARNLNQRMPAQRHWPLLFEAEDDHGLAAQATLRVIQTQGSGENIGTRERSLVLAGSGGARRKRWSHALDLGGLGLSPGDDVIVQLTVSDNRAPRPQQTRSASYILRWPAETGSDASGLDGLVRTTLPAYLRSQRQVIIDAEALLKQRRALDQAKFQQRSSALGDDQQALRLRYGRFLGEERAGGPQLPTSDSPTDELPTSDRPDAAPAATADAHDDDHGALPAPPPRFGQASDVLEAFGHAHDTAESATLFDPKTKETLRSALRQMWESELHLRQGDPAAALPYAYKALAYIKDVQQADRVYLARTGIELPPLDEARRLTGARDGLGHRRDPLAAAPPRDPVPARAWQALQDTPATTRPPIDFDALERWVRGARVEGADPLAVIAAIDALRRAPDCTDCRARLRAALWPLLAPPPASAGTRVRPDPAGQAYLRALEREPAR